MFKTNNYLSFWYYDKAHKEECLSCKALQAKHLLRYRVFWGFNKPLIQVKTVYYLICDNCNEIMVLDGEGNIAPYINKIKNKKPIKFLIKENKRKVKTIEEWVEEHLNQKA